MKNKENTKSYKNKLVQHFWELAKISIWKARDMFDVFKHDISEDIALEHLTSKFYSVLKKLVVIAKKKKKKTISANVVYMPVRLKCFNLLSYMEKRKHE
jgi:hypothetical protein